MKVLYDAVAQLSQLVKWWRGQLRVYVSEWLSRLDGAPLIAVADKDRVVVYASLDSAVSKVIPFDAQNDQVPMGSSGRRAQLIISRQHGLVLPLTITDEAEDNLCQVLSFSMDRYTPFSADEVYFDYKITKRDRASKKLDVMLYVIPRQFLDALLASLGAEQIEVDSVDMALDQNLLQGDKAGVDLGPKNLRRKQGNAKVLNTILAATAALLLLITFLFPLYQRYKLYNSEIVEVEELKKQAVLADQQYREMVGRVEYIGKIVQLKKGTKPVVDVLRELTDLTPDNAWIGQLELKNGRLKLTGEANAGSELIESLSKSEYFKEPQFEAPLTQNPRTDKERFVISLAVKGEQS